MNIISIYPGHSGTVGLFMNGECRSILHEEKFSNVKSHEGFPVEALKQLSKQFPIGKADAILFPSTHCFKAHASFDSKGKGASAAETLTEQTYKGTLKNFYDHMEYHLGMGDFFYHLRSQVIDRIITPQAKDAILRHLAQEHGVVRERVHFLDHHTCHCASPMFFHGLRDLGRDVLLLSMDGAGDNLFAKVMCYRHATGTMESISSSRFHASLGLLYLEVTRFLGMKPNEHEYKVMGLAAYVAEPRYYQHLYERLRKIVWLDEETLTFHSSFNLNLARFYFEKNFVFERFDNVAAAVQKLTEDLVLRWISAAIRKTGVGTIACSGGVFLNVKMNQKIQDLPVLERVYFMPSPGDDSNVMGAAFLHYLENKHPVRPIRTMFLGQRYTDAEVAAFLSQKAGAGYQVRRFDDIEEEIARLLSEFKVVARFNGACEWGPRSLCNRGVLANASDLKSFYEVNDAVKMRDFWMPFAPTIQEEWADRYIKGWQGIKSRVCDSAGYMITAFDSTELAQVHLRAAIHQKDKTLRPQVLDKASNPSLHRLLQCFEKRTGMGGILNTSLNLHGYPLAGTLEQAWFTFENSGLKYMAMENHLVAKPEK